VLAVPQSDQVIDTVPPAKAPFNRDAIKAVCMMKFKQMVVSK
jgi:hypothetical protein